MLLLSAQTHLAALLRCLWFNLLEHRALCAHGQIRRRALRPISRLGMRATQVPSPTFLTRALHQALMTALPRPCHCRSVLQQQQQQCRKITMDPRQFSQHSRQYVRRLLQRQSSTPMKNRGLRRAARCSRAKPPLSMWLAHLRTRS